MRKIDLDYNNVWLEITYDPEDENKIDDIRCSENLINVISDSELEFIQERLDNELFWAGSDRWRED